MTGSLTDNGFVLLLLGYSGIYRSALIPQLNSEPKEQDLFVQPCIKPQLNWT